MWNIDFWEFMFSLWGWWGDVVEFWDADHNFSSFYMPIFDPANTSISVSFRYASLKRSERLRAKRQHQKIHNVSAFEPWKWEKVSVNAGVGKGGVCWHLTPPQRQEPVIDFQLKLEARSVFAPTYFNSREAAPSLFYLISCAVLILEVDRTFF